ncbi:hypothetical protein LTR53_000248 [Teratosphaeriaceae sp. CCFEE 6253]|nr:hypothetical protein LTR53_000248 [Teratosphaeriaceae sp. CCFEE 6253]
MSVPEDAAAVLEQFVHDVANIPAEVTHLLDEINAKDSQIAAFRDEIGKRDATLQKWVRVNGGHVPHAREEAFSKTINDCYDQCEVLQAEKVGLSEKALVVLERQVKRLDVGLRRLTAREEFPADWGGPTLVGGSGSVTGVSTPIPTVGQPLQPLSTNISTTGGAPSIANAAQIRMAQTTAVGKATPAAGMTRSQREGSTDAKRRRLNTNISSLPATSSNLRQSSLGPGTPKAGTPVPGPAAASVISRAGSAQPSRPAAIAQKKAGTSQPQPHHPKRVAPHQGGGGRKRDRARPAAHKKGDRRRQLTRDRDRGTPSTNASSPSASRSPSGSPTPSTLPRSQADGAVDGVSRARSHKHHVDEELGEDDDEDSLYCFCNKVSFGNMVPVVPLGVRGHPHGARGRVAVLRVHEAAPGRVEYRSQGQLVSSLEAENGRKTLVGAVLMVLKSARQVFFQRTIVSDPVVHAECVPLKGPQRRSAPCYHGASIMPQGFDRDGFASHYALIVDAPSAGATQKFLPTGVWRILGMVGEGIGCMEDLFSTCKRYVLGFTSSFGSA